MSNIFFISDTHFYHKNIIEYCDRPFDSVSEMNEKIIENWNGVVRANDVVYHLGDFALGRGEKVKELCARLNGRISLIQGNHDHLRFQKYYECGFSRVYDRPIVVQDDIILSHAPIDLDPNNQFANIFGHVHDKGGSTATRHSFCACVERINYTPIEFGELDKAMRNSKEDSWI